MASLRSLSTCTTASSHGSWHGGPLESTPRGDNNDPFDEVGDLCGARKEGYDDDEYFNGETMRHARQYALDRDQRTWEENRLLSSGAAMRTEVDLDFNGGRVRFSVIREAVECPVRNGNRGYVRPSVCDSHISRRRRKRGGRKERARKERRLHPPSVPSSPTKTVRVRPTPRPNLRDSSDESEGGLMEAFHEKRAKDEGLAVGAAVVGMDNGLAVVETVVGMDDGLAVDEAVVGIDDGLAVDETVVGLVDGLAVVETVVGMDERLTVGAAVVGLDERLAVGAAVVGIDQGIDEGESGGFEVGEEEEDDEAEGE